MCRFRCFLSDSGDIGVFFILLDGCEYFWGLGSGGGYGDDV